MDHISGWKTPKSKKTFVWGCKFRSFKLGAKERLKVWSLTPTKYQFLHRKFRFLVRIQSVDLSIS